MRTLACSFGTLFVKDTTALPLHVPDVSRATNHMKKPWFHSHYSRGGCKSHPIGREIACPSALLYRLNDVWLKKHICGVSSLMYEKVLFELWASQSIIA